MLLAQAIPPLEEFVRPPIDWHALAPELTLLVVGALLTLADIIWNERVRWYMPALAGMGLLATMVPIVTLGLDGTDRELFGGAYVVDDFSLVLKALFVLSGYVLVLMSADYLRDGDYYESEYYQLLLASLLGMVMMASSRDLISIFIALELLSIPAYMMAAWRKGDAKSNEAGVKYYLMGVFASAVMLYGMSLVYGIAGSTQLDQIAPAISGGDASPLLIIGILFTLLGFAFKVSAVPFHTWAPDTYEGAPTPVTAFLAVASKAAGFVALMILIGVGFIGRGDVFQPLMWILAALTMTVGNLLALRQTNIVRMLAYSGVAQGGFMLAPLAVAADTDQAIPATVTYLLIYAITNLAAFTVVIAVSRKTRSGEISSYGGLFRYAPGMTVAMTVALFSLAGIPPLGGWFAKFVVFRALADAGDAWAIALAVVVAVNSVIALFYYAAVARQMWFEDVPDGDETPVTSTPSLTIALAVTIVGTLVVGILPQTAARFGDMATTLVALGG
ncbi:MAG: NADH-quinone oxidoreductase subunit N [Actinomycetota bacterium]